MNMIEYSSTVTLKMDNTLTSLMIKKNVFERRVYFIKPRNG